MAFSEFYVQVTGNDLNAGSDNADSALVTSTNGDWGNAASNRFTAASGTPFSGAVVGQWASIYLDGATVGSFTAQITAVNGSGASIDLSTTLRLGTAPTTGASGRSCKVGGAWAKPGGNGAFNTFLGGTLGGPARVNIRSGTYSYAANGCAISPVTSATNILWLRGYNTTPGDLENELTVTLSRPVLSFSSGALSFGTGNVVLSGLNVVATSASAALLSLSGNSSVDRCRIDNQSANSNASALAVGGAGIKASRCLFKSTTTASKNISAGLDTEMVNCTLIGGVDNYSFSGGTHLLAGCVLRGHTQHGIVCTTATSRPFVAANNTIKGPGSGGDGVRFTALPASAVMANNRISSVNYGLNNPGAATNIVHRMGNVYYSCSAALESGFGDCPSFGDATESSDGDVSVSDLTPKSGALARGSNRSFVFEGETYTTYADAGAVQHQDSGGGVSGARVFTGF